MGERNGKLLSLFEKWIFFQYWIFFQVDVVMKYHESKVGEFSGHLVVDTSSNLFLNLTLFDVQGTLHGLVSGFNSTQAIQIHVGEQSRGMVKQRVRLSSGLLCRTGHVSVVLHPHGAKHQSLVKQLPCNEDTMRQFRHVQPNTVVSVGLLERPDCLGCADTWTYWINPMNWADQAWNTTRIVIGAILALIAIFVLVMCGKFICCIRKC